MLFFVPYHSALCSYGLTHDSQTTILQTLREWFRQQWPWLETLSGQAVHSRLSQPFLSLRADSHFMTSNGMIVSTYANQVGLREYLFRAK